VSSANSGSATGNISATAGDNAAVTYFPPSRPWTEAGGVVRLHGSKCAQCGSAAFPPHPICPACGAQSGQGTVELSPVGTLYTFSEVHIAPKGFATPYAVGYVDLPEGVRLFGQIEGRATTLRVGQQVAVTLGPVRTEASGAAVISYRFRPSQGSADASASAPAREPAQGAA
jgi:uncharacterized OB-fold protein